MGIEMHMSRRLIAIYLKDHLAGATAGVALARRVAESNANTSSGSALAQVAAEIEEDRETLKRLMSELGVPGSRLKNAGAWAAERLARLKLNGRGGGGRGSELQRMYELEALGLGIAGKQGLWDALRCSPEAAAHADLDRLESRARRQREVVEVERLALARAALSADA
ncbi:MAG: hypothetical protein M3Q31_14630 [Actinomycetota bacterium]|nr:hypothetical protein [Actinomycetota bacterium]